MLLFIAPLAAWLYDQVSDPNSGTRDFLRSIPSYFAPKPIGASVPYTPPFTGGQCAGIFYDVSFTRTKGDGTSTRFVGGAGTGNNVYGAVTGIETVTPVPNGSAIMYLVIIGQNGVRRNMTQSSGNNAYDPSNPSTIYTYSDIVFELLQYPNQIDNCGNIPNNTPSPSIPDDGLFDPQNPLIADENEAINPAAIVLVPAIPLALIPLISTAIAAALNAAKNAIDALEAAKKIAEALEGLTELWKLLKEFLDDWKKSRPKNRDIVRQTYGQILGDGALDFFSQNNTKYKAIQLDIVITQIPIGFGKFFGNLSPSRYRYKELGYIAFYSVNQGILEVHSIQFKRTTYQIPELAVGFIYHLGLNDQIKGYAFGTFSVEKS